jgi:hypothetical protein
MIAPILPIHSGYGESLIHTGRSLVAAPLAMKKRHGGISGIEYCVEASGRASGAKLY